MGQSRQGFVVSCSPGKAFLRACTGAQVFAPKPHLLCTLDRAQTVFTRPRFWARDVALCHARGLVRWTPVVFLYAVLSGGLRRAIVRRAHVDFLSGSLVDAVPTFHPGGIFPIFPLVRSMGTRQCAFSRFFPRHSAQHSK